VEPLYFRQVDGPFGLVFREDSRGRITHLFTDLTPSSLLKSWIGTRRPASTCIALGCVLIFLSVIPVAAIRFIRNRRLGGDRKPASRGARAAYWIILGISVLNLLFVVGTAWGCNPLPLFGVRH
jgi:hypothetical protein